jgi:hypothetical protein
MYDKVSWWDLKKPFDSAEAVMTVPVVEYEHV